MKAEEFNKLRNNKLISADDLSDKSDRTLLYGYDVDRKTHHVYLKDCEIFTVDYAYKELPTRKMVKFNSDYVPNKRIYPAASDFEFCSLLKARGEYLSFTSYEERESTKAYHGEIL